MDVERHCMLYWDIDAMRSKLPFRLSKIWQPNLKGWMETFSNHALKILQEQIQTAVNYKVEVIHSSLSWKVSRKEICSENFCIVSRKEPHNNSSLNPLGAGIFNAWSTHDTSAVIYIERVCNPGRHCQGIKRSDKLCKRAGRKPNKGENARFGWHMASQADFENNTGKCFVRLPAGFKLGLHTSFLHLFPTYFVEENEF